MSGPDHAGEMERYAADCALDAAWRTEFWIPADPDFGFLDYFEAAVTRNLGLLWGFETLAEDVDRRGILPPTEGEQATLVTDGGQDLGELFEEFGEYLTPTQQEDYRAVEIEGKSGAQQARDRGVCKESVYSTVKRAKERLREVAEDRRGFVTDGGEPPLPTDEIVTPTLDGWEHRGGGWHTWIDDTDDFSWRVHVEMVTLELPDDQKTVNAFEVRLDDLREGRPYPVVARETLRNSRLAVVVAELLASDSEMYADGWYEGLAPRPEEVGRLDE